MGETKEGARRHAAQVPLPDLIRQLRVDACEISGWGVGNEAEHVRQAADEIATLQSRIAAALDELRTAPDLDTAEPSRAVMRRAHTAILGAWAELADEPPSARGGAS